MRKGFLWFSILVLAGGIGFTVFAGFTTEWNFEEQPDSECSDTTMGATAAVLPASEQAKCWTGGPEEWGGILAGVGITSLGGLLLTVAVIANISARSMSRLRASGVDLSDIDLSGTIPSSFGIKPSGTMAPPSGGSPPSGNRPPPPPPQPPSGPLISG